MELRITGRPKAAGPSIRPADRKGDTAAGSRPRTDRFTLSRQVVEPLEIQSRIIMDLARQAEKKPFVWDMADSGEETGTSEADALGEQMKAMERCHKIAARIMRGDRVPPQDEQYLRMNDPDGYKLAMAMRTPKRNPKKWQSVLKKEDESAQSRQSEGAEAASCGETGEASGSGGGGDLSGGSE